MAEAEAPKMTMLAQAGGRDGVEAIVERFYVFIEADSHMRPIYPEDLGPGKLNLRLFLEQWLGGEPVYSAKYGHPRLRRRHFPFVIDQLAAGKWLRYMRQSMAEQGLPDATLAVIFERLGPLAHHMVNAGEDVPREPLTETFLR